MTEPIMPPGARTDTDETADRSNPAGLVEQPGDPGSRPFEDAPDPEPESNAEPGERGAP
jgi:hypothetical protein